MGAERGRVHREPFVHLVDVAHDRVLVAWGAFFFTRAEEDGARWEIVDDEKLEGLAGRSTCIGHSAESYGDAVVEVLDRWGEPVARAGTDRTWAWVDGLEPDTEYRYRVLVNGESWGAGERWDWVQDPRGGYDLAPAGRHYDLRFTTWPDPDQPTPAMRFVALGDYGVGIRSDSESSRRQRRIADVLDRLVRDGDIRFVVSLGDNIYQGEVGAIDQESGGEDDDWYSSFFQPYRYAIARVAVLPVIGNHDTTDTEGADDRAQMEDNFHLEERFGHHGRSRCSPGLFYSARFGRDLELVGIDTSMDPEEDLPRHFLGDAQRRWLEQVFAADDVRWRIPVSHHPMYCAGPSHEDDTQMQEVLEPLLDRADVRLVLAGHEHNFQIGTLGRRTHVISGAGGKVREEHPDRLGGPGVEAWAGQAHLVVAEVREDRILLTPVSGLRADGQPQPMTAMTRGNQIRRPPFVVG